MTRAKSAAGLTIAAIALIAAFVFLRPSSDTPSSSSTTTTTTAPTTPQADTTPTATGQPARPKPDPGPLLTDAKVTTIKVRQGETVRFRVRSTGPEELHVHGYDLVRPLAAGETRSVVFKATITGIFEIELEESATQIAKLEVDP